MHYTLYCHVTERFLGIILVQLKLSISKHQQIHRTY